MKLVGVIFIAFVLNPSCEGHFIPPWPASLGSLFGGNAAQSSQEPTVVVGTASELAQIRARYPVSVLLLNFYLLDSWSD